MGEKEAEPEAERRAPFKAIVTVTLEGDQDTEALFQAIEPENWGLGEGLSCKGEVVSPTELRYHIATDKDIASIHATVDDLLKSLIVASSVAEAVSEDVAESD